ncbi:SWIM-type domain-containing protein [Citrus sinensis]|nr:SWIM-type domain-containing protein [Citrus sinensis]
MSTMKLVISFKGEKHHVGMINPEDWTVDRIKAEALKITTVHGLDTVGKILLTVMNPDSKVKVVLDSEYGLKCLFGFHNLMGVTTFEVEVVPVLCPQNLDAPLIQSLLFNLGVHLSSEVIDILNDGGTPEVTHTDQEGVSNRDEFDDMQRGYGHEATATIHEGEIDEDKLLSDWSDKRSDNDGEEPVVQPIPTMLVDDIVSVDDIDDSEGSEDSQCESDSNGGGDGLLDDDTRAVEMVVNSSDDDINLGSVKFTKYLEKHEYKLDADGIHRLRLGDVFRDVNHFRQVLHEVMIRKGFNISIKYSEPRRYFATCKEASCPWFVKGARLNDRNGFWLREYQKKHECKLTKKSVKVTSTWVAEMIKGHVAIDANVKISLLKNYMQEKFRLKIEKLTMYRAREKARILVYGDHSKGYEKLFQYAAAIHRAEPGAICKVLCDAVTIPEKCLFQRFFVAFPAQRNAFLNGCRPFIGIDGCHLKGKYGGVLLAAVASDANKGIVPLALCVCEIENTETWTWFLDHLHSYLDNGRQVTFISDRQKGLLNAIPNTWPTAYHRACCRHVYANFAKEHAGANLRTLFWKAAKSSNKHDYEEAMAHIKVEKLAAYNWLERELQGYTWSMHTYDRNCKVEKTDNNASECFNSWILPYRDRPALSMLEEIRCRLMRRFTKRRNEGNTWQKTIAPRIYKELDQTFKKGEKMIVQPSGDLNFQVMDKSYYPARRFIVKLEDKTCDCGFWEIAGLPCCHAMAAIGYARHEIEEYIPFCFTKQAYINTYSVMFSPIPDERTWEHGDRPLIDAPIVRKKIGRPKKCRKRAATEPQKRSRRFFVNCSVCGGSNHNVRSCPLRPSVARPSKATNTNSQLSIGNSSGQSADPLSQPSKPTRTRNTARRDHVPSDRSKSSSAGSMKRKSANAVGVAGTSKKRGKTSHVNLSQVSQSQNPSQASTVTCAL